MRASTRESILFFSVGAGVLLVWLGAYLLGLQAGKARHAMTNTLNAQHRKDDRGLSLGGKTTGPGLSISWKGKEEPGGAEPLDLIAAAEDRLVFLQTTTAGGNETAKALWEVQQCREKLQAIYDKSKTGLGNGSGAGFGGTSETRD